MALRVFKQPDGQYAVFSNTTDSFLIEDATEEEVKDWFIERKKREAEQTITGMLEKAESGDYVHPRGPRNYEEAANWPESLESSSDGGSK